MHYFIIVLEAEFDFFQKSRGQRTEFQLVDEACVGNGARKIENRSAQLRLAAQNIKELVVN